MNILRYLTFFGLICLFFNSEAAVVLKTKNNQALIHLEGIKTKRGAYFFAVDLYGRKKGIIQVKRVAHTKAIGVLKYGSFAKRWSLEPTNRRTALAVQRKAQRRTAQIARIQKEKLKRRAARLAQKRKRSSRRSLASYDEYIMDDLPEDSEDQSEEILSYNLQHLSAPSSQESHSGETSDETEEESSESEDFSEGSKKWIVGLSPRFEYNFMNLSPANQEEYLMKGMGGGLALFSDFSISPVVRLGVSLGGRYFSAQAEEDVCGNEDGCSLAVYYLTAGLDLKLDVITLDDHKIFLSGRGVLMQPLFYSNNVLEEKSFSPFHGTVGAALGVDFNLGNVIIPLSLSGDFYMPSSATVMIGTVGLQAGLAYKF